MTERYNTLGNTTLAEDLDASETGVDVASAAALRDNYATGDTYTIKCENELMRVTAESGNTLTVTRAHGGTTGATHANGTAIYQVIDESALDQIKRDANIVGISGNNSISVLGADATLSGSSGVYGGSGLSVILPSAGRYLVVADARASVNFSSGGGFVDVKLRNTTDGSDASTFTRLVYTETSGQFFSGCGTIHALITIAASKTIELYVARGFTGSVSTSALNAERTALTFIKLSD